MDLCRVAGHLVKAVQASMLRARTCHHWRTDDCTELHVLSYQRDFWQRSFGSLLLSKASRRSERLLVTYSKLVAHVLEEGHWTHTFHHSARWGNVDRVTLPQLSFRLVLVFCRGAQSSRVPLLRLVVCPLIGSCTTPFLGELEDVLAKKPEIDHFVFEELKLARISGMRSATPGGVGARGGCGRGRGFKHK